MQKKLKHVKREWRETKIVLQQTNQLLYMIINSDSGQFLNNSKRIEPTGSETGEDDVRPSLQADSDCYAVRWAFL